MIVTVSTPQAVQQQAASAAAASAGAATQQQHKAASRTRGQLSAGLQQCHFLQQPHQAGGAGCGWLSCQEASYAWEAW